jgi:hypothetical protein
MAFFDAYLEHYHISQVEYILFGEDKISDKKRSVQFLLFLFCQLIKIVIQVKIYSLQRVLAIQYNIKF